MGPVIDGKTLVGMSRAIDDVRTERVRQISEEGFSAKDDDENNSNGQLALAAASFALYAGGRADIPWPSDWDKKWWKPGDKRRALVKAAALICAEIERLDRKEKAEARG